MVADQRAQRAERKASWRRAIRDGLDSLTVTGPSAVLDEMCREAREAVENRPTQQQREAALDQAWAAFDKVDELIIEGDMDAAMQAMDEAYSLLRAATSRSRRS